MMMLMLVDILKPIENEKSKTVTTLDMRKCIMAKRSNFISNPAAARFGTLNPLHL